MEHPLKALFGDNCATIELGINSRARLAMIHPEFFGWNFGSFSVPTEESIQSGQSLEKIGFQIGALTSSVSSKTARCFVPPETGRSVLLQPTSHRIFRYPLIKGTGLVRRFTGNNKLRDSKRGFNGKLELSEACRDFVHSNILQRAGLTVAQPIAVIDHQRLIQCDGFVASSGNYLRAFREQTRLSNLFEFPLEEQKKILDHAILRIKEIWELDQAMTYEGYFNFMLATLARAAAVYQAIGFTQDSLHHGQVTLAGELVDLGIGNFKKPDHEGVVNSLHPWFRFERQPILFQNMLIRTHALKAEPYPVELSENSETLRRQESLWGIINRIDPSAGQRILEKDPAATFWKYYRNFYSHFDAERFQRGVLSKRNEYFDWEPDSEIFRSRYVRKLEEVKEHYETQDGHWEKLGPTSLHKQILFLQLTTGRIVTKLNFPRIKHETYFSAKEVNGTHDLSFIPGSFGRLGAADAR